METLLPDLSPAVMAFLMAAGFFAGFIDSVAGGGGLISLPAMLLVGIPPQTALGTGKFMATLGTSAAFISFARNGAIVWRIAVVGFVFSLLGSAAGARTAIFVSNAMLGKVILCLLPLAALLTFVPVRKNFEGQAASPLALYLLTPLICAAIGFYDGFFGPGTGSFLLLALHLVLGLGLVAASGTSKVFNLASNISGLTVFLFFGKVWFLAALPMALANIAGNLAGTRLALRGGPRIVRRMLLFSLGLLFVSLVVRYYM